MPNEDSSEEQMEACYGKTVRGLEDDPWFWKEIFAEYNRKQGPTLEANEYHYDITKFTRAQRAAPCSTGKELTCGYGGQRSQGKTAGPSLSLLYLAPRIHRPNLFYDAVAMRVIKVMQIDSRINVTWNHLHSIPNVQVPSVGP